MDEKDKIIANTRFSAMVLGIAASGLQDLIATIIKISRDGTDLTDDVLADALERCVINLKNSEMIGAPIEQEAETFRQSIETFRHFVNGAFSRTWED